jgi:hypothetical protein
MRIFTFTNTRLLKTASRLFVTVAFVINWQFAGAQSLLKKQISVNIRQHRLADALNEISREGGFHFSYNGQILAKDSLVSISSSHEPVNLILDRLLKTGYTYSESQNYVIINRALQSLSLINTDVTNEDDAYSVSGIIINDRSGERLMNASVYEKQLLVSALTDEHGYFKLRFKNSAQQNIAITISKSNYKDTTVRLLSSVTVSSRSYVNLHEKRNYNRVEHTGFGKFFISTKQKIQSLNIPDFFAKRPFQVSLTPGLSSHGLFGSQVINKFSLNLAGGYAAGANGFEAGGLFNIDKYDVKYVQLAGIFNLVGGSVTGLQAAIISNNVLDTVKGAQVAAFFNEGNAQVSGLQLSALHNNARKLKGVQVGLINKADTSEGISIGVLNIIYNGFYRASASVNNVANTNLALKTGTHQFYSVLNIAANVSPNQKLLAFGMGIGHDFMFGKNTYLSAEADYQFAYTGAFDDRWAQFKILLNLPLYKNISLTAGPAYSKYSYTGSQPGYRTMFIKPEVPQLRNPVKRFVGWEAGLTFSSVFKKPVERPKSAASKWYLGLAATAGIGWDDPLGSVLGGEIFAQKDLSENAAATLSVGYTRFSVENRLYDMAGNKMTSTFTANKQAPIKAGIRLKAGDLIYVSGDAGISFGTSKPVISIPVEESLVKLNKAFVYSFTTGLAFNNGLDAGLKFEDYDATGNLKQFALRLAYRMKVSK